MYLFNLLLLQIKIKLEYYSGEVPYNANFFTKKYLTYFSIEFVLTLIQPYSFLEGNFNNFIIIEYKFTTQKEWFNIQITYNINDILVCFSFIRFFVIYRYLISTGYYFSPQASRVS